MLRGKLGDLVLSEPSPDFVIAILTDKAPLIDPMRRLREVFPNACQLIYARDERAPELKSALPTQIMINDPVQVIGDFLEHVRAERLVDTELALVASAFHDLQKEENVA